jgi:hypothetical protein
VGPRTLAKFGEDLLNLSQFGHNVAQHRTDSDIPTVGPRPGNPLAWWLTDHLQATVRKDGRLPLLHRAAPSSPRNGPRLLADAYRAGGSGA